MGNAFAHKGIAKGKVTKGDTATAAIDAVNREAIKRITVQLTYFMRHCVKSPVNMLLRKAHW